LALKYPLFKMKQDVVNYLTEYSKLYELDENIAFHRKVTSVEASETGNPSINWVVKTSDGKSFLARYVVVCTGYCAQAYTPKVANIDSFKGEVMHTWGIKNCSSLAGKRVLIVGSGNSAMEILVDAARHGAQPDLLVSAPRYILSRNMMEWYYKCVFSVMSLFGKGSISSMIAEMHALPVDSDLWRQRQIEDDDFYQRISTDLTSYGIAKPSPLRAGESASERRAVFDVGAIDLIKSGKVKVHKGEIMSFHEFGVDIALEEKEANKAVLRQNYDCVIFGTVTLSLCVCLSFSNALQCCRASDTDSTHLLKIMINTV
jgi:indole-3-pyruvate monooxygenase